MRKDEPRIEHVYVGLQHFQQFTNEIMDTRWKLHMKNHCISNSTWRHAIFFSEEFKRLYRMFIFFLKFGTWQRNTYFPHTFFRKPSWQVGWASYVYIERCLLFLATKKNQNGNFTNSLNTHGNVKASIWKSFKIPLRWMNERTSEGKAAFLFSTILHILVISFNCSPDGYEWWVQSCTKRFHLIIVEIKEHLVLLSFSVWLPLLCPQTFCIDLFLIFQYILWMGYGMSGVCARARLRVWGAMYRYQSTDRMFVGWMQM